MIFIDACFRRPTPHTPVWMMRQAGRYLPEYMETRKKAGDFLSLCKNPELACEVTLQPIDILGVDAAILFSDILVVPLEMGLGLEFLKGEGPKFLQTTTTQKAIEALDMDAADKLGYVYEAVSMIREKLDSSKALIGFCGAPWTLATYMIEGQGSKTYALTKKMAYSEPQTLHLLLEKLTHVLIAYLQKQIDHGANAVMIFDSWASALEKEAYLEFGWSYIKKITAAIKAKNPNIPVIAFPKGISPYLDAIDGDFDVFGVDWSTPIELAKEQLGAKYVLQGNMEPCRLYSKDAIKEGVENIIKTMGNKEGHIFNLGHGILPDILVENAKYFIHLVQTLTKR